MTSCVFYNDEFLFLFQPLFRLGGPHNAGLGFAAVKLDLQTLYVPSGWVAGANTPGVVRGISAPTVIRHEQFCAWVLSSLWTKGTSIKGLRKHLVLFHALGQLRRLLLFEIQLPLLASNRPIHVGLRCVPCFLGEAADSLLRTLRAERFEKQCDSLPTRLLWKVPHLWAPPSLSQSAHHSLFPSIITHMVQYITSSAHIACIPTCSTTLTH